MNDENRPLNSNIKPLNSNTKTLIRSTAKKLKNSPSLERKQQIKTNLVEKIENFKNPLAIKSEQPLKTTERRLSSEKSTKIMNNKPIRSRLSSERRLSSEKSTAIEKQIKKNNDKQINDRLDQQLINQPIKQSVIDKPTKSSNINLNDDQHKNRLAVENELVKLKFFNSRIEIKLRKHNQTVVEIVKDIYNLIKSKRDHCLELKQQLVLKETLFFLLELIENNQMILKDADLNKLELYLTSVSNTLNSALSTFKINNLKNAGNINGIFF